MGKSSVSDKCREAVTLLARGLAEAKITQEMGGSVDVRKLLSEASDEWQARNPSALAVAFVDRLPSDELPAWKEWASEHFARLQVQSGLKKQIIAAFALPRMASLQIVELAEALETDSVTLNREITELLDALPGVETRAGLITVCYLAQWESLAACIGRLPEPKLSRRERQVLELITLGLKDLAIGKRLHISLNTVKTHIGRLSKKLDVKGRKRLGLIYLHRYMTVQDRLRLRSTCRFRWPLPGRRRVLLEALLTWRHCDKTCSELGEELGFSENTVKDYLRGLMNRMDSFPRTRLGLIVAALLHEPE